MSKFKVGDKVKQNVYREIKGIGEVARYDESLPFPVEVFINEKLYVFSVDELDLVKQVKEKKVMKKEKVIERFYVVQRGDEVVDHADTREQARRTQQACGGASNGVKIFQHLTIQKEVR